MIIYKITNIVNGKIYIGQTIRSKEWRFKRHIYDALNNVLDTYFARAIRKYGPDNFIIEEIDTAQTKEELDEKEIYWINFYNSNSKEIGYNMTHGGECGNTYLCKTDEEMEEIKSKIRATKTGGKNPMAVPVKCKNVVTGEEYHFDSVSLMQKFFNEKTHRFITTRVLHQTKSLYKHEWNISYESEEYDDSVQPDRVTRTYNHIYVQDIVTGEEKEFNSYSKAAKHFGLKYHHLMESTSKIRKTDKTFCILDRYYFTILD